MSSLFRLQQGLGSGEAGGTSGSGEGPKAPLHDLDEALNYHAPTPTWIVGSILKRFQESNSHLFHMRCGNFEEPRNAYVISPTSWVYNKEISILGIAGFICVWREF